jgi:hypothetical protein
MVIFMGTQMVVADAHDCHVAHLWRIVPGPIFFAASSLAWLRENKSDHHIS